MSTLPGVDEARYPQNHSAYSTTTTSGLWNCCLREERCMYTFKRYIHRHLFSNIKTAIFYLHGFYMSQCISVYSATTDERVRSFAYAKPCHQPPHHTPTHTTQMRHRSQTVSERHSVWVYSKFPLPEQIYLATWLPFANATQQANARNQATNTKADRHINRRRNKQKTKK